MVQNDRSEHGSMVLIVAEACATTPRSAAVLAAAAVASAAPPSLPPTATRLIHPHRALTPGKQWVSHCGAKQKARYLKQQRALQHKQAGLPKHVEIDPDDGGLILHLK